MAKFAKNRGHILFLVALAAACLSLRCGQLARGESIALASVLPKIEAIHEDAKSLLIKNVELKNQILAGYQAQNEDKILSVKEGKSIGANDKQQPPPTPPLRPQGPNAEQAPAIASMTKQKKLASFPAPSSPSASIDYQELEEFNKWVEVNLEYAVKNTQATAEALKDEAQSNNGNVEYTEQAVKDGIEGVKYWQAAVIFQDKTLKHEKFDPQLD